MTAQSVNPKMKPIKNDKTHYTPPAKQQIPQFASFGKHLPWILVLVLFLLMVFNLLQ